MKLTKKEVEDILQLEINWCLDHPDPTLNHDQRMGFVNGLRQAQLLIRNAEKKLVSTITTCKEDLRKPNQWNAPEWSEASEYE